MQHRFALSLVCTALLPLTICLAQVPLPEIPQPRSIRAVNGVLTDTLRLEMANLTIMGRQVQTRTYNSEPLGAIWRVLPGDTIRVHLNNQLPPNPDADLPDQGNVPQRANTTNLHVHGMNVSPKGNGDNVLLSIQPGESFDYVFAIPADHPAGTNWYHPHHHTSTFPQIMNGLAGTIVVEDPADATVTDTALGAMQDRVFVFTAYQVDTLLNVVPYPNRLTRATALVPMPGVESPVYVNGVLNGSLSMRPGEIQRWRFVNATYELSVRLRWLRIANGDTTDVEHVHIANDGLYRATAARTSQIEFTSGARMDMLVRAPEDSGTYVVVMESLDRSMQVMERRTMATIMLTGDAVVPAMTMPDRLPKAIPQGSIANDEITGSRELVFRIGDLGPIQSDSTAISRIFTIDNTPFDHDVVNITLKAGDVEEWTIRNDSRGYHPFHIHVNEFQVVEVGGVRLEEPEWHDVLLLAPYTTYKIRHRFGEFDGKTVLHCHFLPHEDWGMMQLIDILPASTSVHDEPWNHQVLFPNPIAGRLQRLSVPLPTFLGDRALTVTLHDVMGAVVQRVETTAQQTPTVVMDVAAYPAGTYFVRVDDGQKYATSDMVILVR